MAQKGIFADRANFAKGSQEKTYLFKPTPDILQAIISAYSHISVANSLMKMYQVPECEKIRNFWIVTAH